MTAAPALLDSTTAAVASGVNFVFSAFFWPAPACVAGVVTLTAVKLAAIEDTAPAVIAAAGSSFTGGATISGSGPSNLFVVFLGDFVSMLSALTRKFCKLSCASFFFC